MPSRTNPAAKEDYKPGNILDHLDKLTPSKGGKYHCPVCNGNDLSIHKESGATTCHNNGCEWKAIMDAIAPLDPSKNPKEWKENGNRLPPKPGKKSKKEVNIDVIEAEIEIDAKTTELAYQSGNDGLTAAAAAVILAAWCQAKGYDKFSASQQLKAKIALDKKQRERNGDFDDDDSENQTRLQRDYWRLERAIGANIAFDEATQDFYLDGRKFNIEGAKLTLSIDRGIPIKSGKEDVMDICVKLAQENTFNSVVDYLESCHQKSPIDLDQLAPQLLGTGEDQLAATFLRKWLIAAVARAYEPGVKADDSVIFQGKQGQRKSSFFEALVPHPEWFNQNGLKGGKINDEEIRNAHRVWLTEIAEIDKLFKRATSGDVKTFMTVQREWIRPLYAKMPIQLARHGLMAGTTNEQELFTDETGNRRYMVIPITVDKIDVEWVKLHRDNIWSAAVIAYKRGDIHHLTPQEEAEHHERNKQYQLEHPWLGLIEQYLVIANETSVGEILFEVLKMDFEKATRSDQMQVAGILKSLGFQKTGRRLASMNQRQTIWEKLPAN